MIVLYFDLGHNGGSVVAPSWLGASLICVFKWRLKVLDILFNLYFIFSFAHKSSHNFVITIRPIVSITFCKLEDSPSYRLDFK